MSQLVLSLFPGIGLLDMAFEEEGFCVVRGPDLLWGGDIKRFHPPAGKFDGVIGGPPCQEFSPLRYLVRHHHGYNSKFGNLIPEFERCVSEASPEWFLMENVPQAPRPIISGYKRDVILLDNNWVGGDQRRLRRFTFGTRDRRRLRVELAALYRPDPDPPVTSSDGGVGVKLRRYSLADACLLQGLPSDFLAESPLRKDGALKAIANGVPLPMGRAVAKAVKRATQTVESVA